MSENAVNRNGLSARLDEADDLEGACMQQACGGDNRSVVERGKVTTYWCNEESGHPLGVTLPAKLDLLSPSRSARQSPCPGKRHGCLLLPKRERNLVCPTD